MSAQSWIEEFYPIPVSSRVTKEQALEHSLLKWKGLREHNLTQRHGLARPPIMIGDSTCALCHWFAPEHAVDYCAECPLAKIRLGIPCDARTELETRAPYGEWASARNPEPIIALIEAAIKARDQSPAANIPANTAELFLKDPV